MGKLVLHSAISLDGFATGPGGDLSRLHDWLFDFDEGTPTSFTDDISEAFRRSGAVIFGRRTWDSGQQPWGDDAVFAMPVFVLTHETMRPIARNGTVFTFVSGIEEAVRQAFAAAGGRDVAVMGSPAVAQAVLAAGLADELQLHLVPVLLGGGTPYFAAFDGAPIELEPAGVAESPVVSSLIFRVR